MRKSFPGYYRPSEDEFSRLWADCWFVLDANVLLNLYRYSKGTREALFGILQAVSNRLWVPHQAASEYHRRRLEVIAGQAAAYENIRGLLRKAQGGLDNEVRAAARPGRHPFIKVEELLEKIHAAIAEIERELDDLESGHPDLLAEDPIKETIAELLDGKVGAKYSTDRLEKVYKQGKSRYEGQIPPGYRDAGKGGTRQYGDLVLWLQVIDKATETKKPVIMVTDDRKEDWWLQFKGRTISARPELVEEMQTEAGVSFYMYPADPFMEHAERQLKRRIEPEAIDEVRDLRERDEEEIRARRAEIVRRISQEARHRLAEADDAFSQAYERRTQGMQLPPGYRSPHLGDYIAEIVQQVYSRYTPDQLEEFERQAVQPYGGFTADQLEELKRQALEPYGELPTYLAGYLRNPYSQIQHTPEPRDLSPDMRQPIADVPQAEQDTPTHPQSEAESEDEPDQATANGPEDNETHD